jgi:hypothetical protein
METLTLGLSMSTTFISMTTRFMKTYSYNIVVTTLLSKSARMTFTLPKWGLGSSQGLPKLQSSISGVKTPCIEAFFISLKNHRSVDVENGLAWAIWTFEAQSYDKKKGHESNWQFDSQLLKVGNQPNPSVCKWSATHYWKDFDEGYNFALDLIMIGGLHEVMRPQSRGSPNCWNFGTPTWESQDKKSFGFSSHGELHSILYGGRWWLPPSLGRGESCESRVARGLS